ncbi:hypothetical protein B296_00049857 [Ensete ventricosum]|uniref:Uncharacterized protein n=1 Tax=Ensete ventricosum TaxID=4639 RepID=A0A426X0F1_ENSVE|nr:hypothetical protein B296_00049857 [Ensete ventricosum]
MNPNTVGTNSNRHHLPPSPCVPARPPPESPRGAPGATLAIRRLPAPSPMIRRKARQEQQREPRPCVSRLSFGARLRLFLRPPLHLLLRSSTAVEFDRLQDCRNRDQTVSMPWAAMAADFYLKPVRLVVFFRVIV